jgi:opacity protein-like surface antigen
MTPFRALAALALSVAIAPAAYAQDTTTTQTTQTTQGTFSPVPPESEGFSVTPFVGIGFAGDLENSPTAFGLAAGYGLNEHISLEGDLYFAPGGEQGVEDVLTFDTNLWSLSANVLYNFTGGETVTPYVAAGLGMLSGDADIEDVGVIEDDTSTAFAWNWGAGVKTGLSDRIGLRADLRFFNGDDLAADHWRLVGGVIIRNIGQ